MEALDATRAKHVWPMVRLGDVCEDKICKLKHISDSHFDYIDISSIDRIHKRISNCMTFERSSAPSRAQQVVEEGDVLVSTVRPNLNAVALVGKKKNLPQIASTGFCVLRAKSEVLPQYIYYFTQTAQCIKDLVSVSEKAAYPSVTDSIVKNLQIPLPPHNIQHEIVERLERELAEADSLAANFRRIAELADAEFKAELDETFTDAHGEVVCLGDVCTVDGVLVKDVEKYELFPHIGIDCIEKGTGRLLPYRTVGEDGIKSGKYYFSSRHIIYSKIRPNLNKVAVPEFEGLCSADSYPILPSERCNRYWLAYLMRSAVFLNYVVPISNTRTGMPKVNREELLNFEFMLPPLAKQQQIVLKLDAAGSQCEKLKAAAERGLRASETLRAAILSEAFAP